MTYTDIEVEQAADNLYEQEKTFDRAIAKALARHIKAGEEHAFWSLVIDKLRTARTVLGI